MHVMQMVHADRTSGELHRAQFGHWAGRHCPRLLIGLREWTKSLLFPQKDEAGEQATPTTTPTILPYQLPVAELDKSEKPLEREVEVYTLIWALSTVIPMVYFGQKDTGKLTPKVDTQGGEWAERERESEVK